MNDDRPRLFLVSPPMPDPVAFPARFAAAAAAGDVACLLVRCADTEETMMDLVASVMPTGYEHNVAIIVDGNADLAARSGADGVQLPCDLATYRNARALLGSDRIVGVLSDGSRHEAMELGDAGVDYMAFDQTRPVTVGSGATEEKLDPLSWWSELFEVQCVAFCPVAVDAVADAIRAGADFIRPDDGMWSSIDRASDTVRRYNAQIDDST